MPDDSKNTSSSSTNVDSDFLNPNAPKDPNMAALIAFLCMCILSLPALAYLYLGNTRKALIYCVAPFVVAVVLLAIFLISTFLGIFTFGISMVVATCLIFPFAFVALLFDILVILDVYKIAKREKPVLPEF
jgi:uncharacterized membrane protein